MTDRSRAIAGCVIVAVLLAASAGLATERSLDRHIPGWEVARLAPQTGRLVLDHQGEMVVVRSGQAVTGLPGVRLKTIGPRGALLEIEEAQGPRDSKQHQPKQWLLIRSTADGAIEVIKISREAGDELRPEIVTDTSLFPVIPQSDQSQPVPGAGADGGEPQ